MSSIGIAETYDDVAELVYDTCWKFKRRYGGDFDDLLSQANLAFMESYGSYQTKYRFSTWVRTIVWNRLLDEARRISFKWHQLHKRGKQMIHLRERWHMDGSDSTEAAT